MVITIKRFNEIDADRNGQLSDAELKAIAKKEGLTDAQLAQLKKDGAALQKKLSSADKSEVGKSGENSDPKAKMTAELEKVQQKIVKLEKDLQNAKNEAQKAKIQQELQKAQQRAESLSKQLGGGKKMLSHKSTTGSGSNTNSAKFKATTTGSSTGTGAGSAKATGAGTGNAKATSTGGPFSLPSNWGAQTAGASFNSSAAYLSSMALEDDIMSSMDSINKNQNRGEQLMRLFFYFSKMAQSGDMGAMYQFMKFLTYIISKDKAKQQIDMGKKLIQLQDLSRKWTSKLMNLSTDSSDPNASNELMKEMTLVKSETDAIATSQKLISQMMEEFAQVVESLTNSTKAALDAHGRIQRTVSQAR